MISAAEKRLINVEEYHKMADVGILKDNEHVELINGEIIKNISPIKSKHNWFTTAISNELSFLLHKKAVVLTQGAIRINKLSEPEPDIAILKKQSYLHHHPKPKDIYLLIEISESTLRKDLNDKMKLYASADIPEYWVINLVDDNITIFQKPDKGIYQTQKIVGFDEIVNIPYFDLSLNIEELVSL